jgi:hypothetical protein
MSRRNKIIIAVVVALLILLALLFYFLIPRPGADPEAVNDTIVNQPLSGGLLNSTSGANINRGTAQPIVNENSAVPQPPPPPDDRSNLRRVASFFAERFGSFSNQSDYENIDELKVLMTARMRTWADSYVTAQREAKQGSAVYFGVTTRAISTDVTEFDEAGPATVKVSTQRSQESGETFKTKVYYQDMVIDFVKEGEIWKIDSAIWQPI